ncbi:hypothetical protein ACFVEN_35105 [Streptomyces sp. NPDC057681]|uniref:hypothetical protein n=1 Tax=Streptomyces sp. NPDC057681 TaxID=3346209 RepID=UPI00369ECBE7
MSISSCELCAGRKDEQKRALSQGLIQAVRAVTDEPLSEMSRVIREGLGIHFIEVGEHLANRRRCSHE